MKQLAISHQIRKLTYNPIVTSKKVKKNYKQGMTISGRAVYLLKHKGYSNIFILKNGYDAWNGKVKKGD